MTGPLLITVDVEGIVDADQDYSVDRLVDLLEGLEVPATLFVTPSIVRNRAETVAAWVEGDHRVALHVHPARHGGNSDWLATYDAPEIARFLAEGGDTFEECVGFRPSGFRAGRWSFSEAVLQACSMADIEWDASLRPDRRRDPYTRSGVTEYPMSVYGNRVVEALLRGYDIDVVPLHADALARSRLRTVLLYGTTWRLLVSDLPYTMVSFHDYDLVDDGVRRRIERYLLRLSTHRTAATLPDLSDRNTFPHG